MSEQLDIIQPKPDELIYAQTAAYAHEQPYQHGKALAKDIGGTATAFLGGDSIVTREENIFGDLKGEKEHTPQDYVEFLRNMDEETRSDVRFLAEKMQDYKQYKDEVNNALSHASEGDEHYLGRGSNGIAFTFEHDNETLVVKSGGVEYPTIRAFNRAEGIEGVSHLLGADLDSNRIVMNLVPGTQAPRLTDEERFAIPKEHISGVIDKALELYDAGIDIDPKPSNFLYDTEKGFGIIDYHARKSDGKRTRTEQAMGTSLMLTFNGTNTNAPHEGDPGYEAYRLERAQRDVKILNPFLDVLEEDYPDILKDAAVEQAKDNANTKRATSGFYPVYEMPTDTPDLLAFKERVISLGLQGDEPVPVEHEPYEPDEDGVW